MDLAFIAILSFVVELMADYCVNALIHGIRPFPVVGMLLTLVAITRWNWYGVIIIPINALANFICGRFLLPAINYNPTYDLVSTIVSIVSTGAILIAFSWFKKVGKANTFKDMGSMFLMLGTAIIINLVLCVLFSSVYYIVEGTSTLSPSDFAGRILGMALYNAFGYVVLLIGTPLLNKQDVLVDVKQRLLEKKRERANEELYYSKKQDDKKN